jgi:predicted SnoaL-like aldol condensation-catalyzing enzyme
VKLWKFAALPLLAIAPAFAQGNAAQLEANKKVVMRFFNDNIFANPEKIDEVIHPDYIQHNPMFQRFNEENNVSGRDGLKKFLASRAQGRGGQGKQGPPPGAAAPAPPTRVVTAEGDLVTVVSSRNMMDKDGKPYTAWGFDTWRVKDGKLYEHWDAATLPTQ